MLNSRPDPIDLEWDDDHVLPSKVYPDVAFLSRRMTEVTLGEVGAKRGEIILDIGCGRAIDAVELARKGDICIGIEPSKKMLDHARKSIAESDMEVSLVRGMGEHLPFRSGSLDRFWCETLGIFGPLISSIIVADRCRRRKMLRDRYEPMDIFQIVPGLTLAMEPKLAQLDRLLEDDALFQKVKNDLGKRFPRTLIDGRLSTPVEVILRMIVIKHLYGWSY